MEANFWHQMWSEGRIGFHQAQANPMLVAHWQQLQLPKGTPVFVPLCGKSQDMIWLADQGHPVVGVELNRSAIEAFDAENKLQGSWSEHEGLSLYSAGPFRLWHADLFALDQRHTGGTIEAVFDRAALIALPPPVRLRYSQHLQSLAAPGCVQLLICLEYEQALREGPPFAVMSDEVQTLYADWQPALIERRAIDGKSPASHDSAYKLQLPTA